MKCLSVLTFASVRFQLLCVVEGEKGGATLWPTLFLAHVPTGTLHPASIQLVWFGPLYGHLEAFPLWKWTFHLSPKVDYTLSVSLNREEDLCMCLGSSYTI